MCPLPIRHNADTAATRRLDPAAESADPSKQQGDTSQLTPDEDILQQEQPIESAIEKTFPGPVAQKPT